MINNHTVLHIFAQALFWARNQGNHQNFDRYKYSVNVD